MKKIFVADIGSFIKFNVDLKDKAIQILKINNNIPKVIGFSVDGKLCMNDDFKNRTQYICGLFYLKDIKLEDLGRYVFCGLGLEVDLQIRCRVYCQ